MAKPKPNNTFVMVTTEFGYDLFIGKLDQKGNMQVTDKAEEAQLWDPNFDQTKIEYHRAVTGYKGLEFRSIN